MSTQIHVNQYLVSEVRAARHPNLADLITLDVDERAGGHTSRSSLTMHQEFWQRVVDQLALLGITPTVSTGSAYECGRCEARFGIAGVNTGSDEDRAAEEQYRADVEYHESGQCGVVVPITPEVPC